MADALLRRDFDRVFDPGLEFPSRLLLSETIARVRAEAVAPPRKRSVAGLRIPHFAVQAAAAVLVVAVAAGAVVFLATRGPKAPAPGAIYRPVLVYTSWEKDERVTGGPQPGYRPVFTSLTSNDMSAATAVLDATGTVWIVSVTFTPRGAQLFAALTRANVAACPGDPTIQASANCPERHLTVWLDLTQADIDHWEDAAYAGRVSSAFDLQCLSREPVQKLCGKFVTDPITLEEIDGGRAQISGSFSEQDAKTIARAIDEKTS